MGSSKLREWVWTVTGKGDRSEGDGQVGRSEPAFGVARTTALPPPTCTARREAGPLRLLAVVVFLQGLSRSDRPPAVFACSGLVQQAVLTRHLCHAMPTAHIHQPPFYFALPPPVHFHVRQDRRGSCKDCPVGSYNTGLQWRPVRRFLTLSFLPAESIDPGPWFV